MLLEQPSQHLAPSKGCADLVFFCLLLWQNPQLCLPYIWLMFSACCFLVFKSFHKKYICHWAMASIVVADRFAVLVFVVVVFWGSYITPFRWVLLFQNNSAVIHKVAQCVIPMQIRYILIYFIHHIRTGPLHMLKLFSSWICVLFFCQPHMVTSHISHSQFLLRAKSWLTVLHRTQSIANIPAKTVNN